VKDYQVMSKRRRRDQAVHGRTDGDTLSPGKTKELRRLFVQTEFHRVFHKLGCFQGVLYLPIGTFFANSLEQLLIDRKTQNSVVRGANRAQVERVGT